MADYSKLKVTELKELLKQRGIVANGKKQALIDALETDDAENGADDEQDDGDDGADDSKATNGSSGMKRSASPLPADSGRTLKQPRTADSSAKVSEAQIVSKDKTSHIPVDEACPLANHRVYIDPSGIIYDASLNITNSSSNNNKFYRVQLLQSPTASFFTWTRWGRVGEQGQHALLGSGSLNDALRNFDKKFKDKSGLKWADRGQEPKSGKYVFVEKSYVEDSDDDETKPEVKQEVSEERSWSPPKCKLEPAVKSLMELIFNQQYFDAVMTSLNYDSNKLPLGKLSKATITRGFQALKNLSEVIDDQSLAAERGSVEHLSNLYYSTIPHAFGRNRPPVISLHTMLKQELELLESLSDLKDADNIIKAGKEGQQDLHPLDSRYHGLQMQEMTPLLQDSVEFTEITQYLNGTCGQTHGFQYQVQDVFRIERQGELDRFTQSPYASVASDRRLLWHGSRATNYGGILGQGLRIAPPEAPVSGYMFDKGIYLADMSSKSAGYCHSFLSGGEGLLLLCEAELGDPMQVLQHAMSNAATEAKKKGAHSTLGQGNTIPVGWKDAGCVHPDLAGVKMPDTSQPPGPATVGGLGGLSLLYNEYICYDVAQVRLRYLLRVRL